MNDLDTVTLMTHSITYDSCEVTNPQIQMDADLPTFLAYCLHIPNVIPYLQQTYLTDFSNVNMMVADALAPIWCQGICNHHTDFVCSASNPSTSGMFHHNILVYPIIIPQFIWQYKLNQSYTQVLPKQWLMQFSPIIKQQAETHFHQLPTLHRTNFLLIIN